MGMPDIEQRIGHASCVASRKKGWGLDEIKHVGQEVHVHSCACWWSTRVPVGEVCRDVGCAVSEAEVEARARSQRHRHDRHPVCEQHKAIINTQKS